MAWEGRVVKQAKGGVGERSELISSTESTVGRGSPSAYI